MRAFHNADLNAKSPSYHKYAIPRAHTQAVFSKVSNLKCGFRLLI